MMDGINSTGLLMTRPMPSCLEEELNKRFRVYRFWDFGSRPELLHGKSDSIRAVVTNAKGGVNAAMIDALPKLEIVATYSVGFDSIDLEKCREKGIRVTNTPDVLTDDVADTAIALALATLRRICECDRFVRRGAWMNENFKLTAKFSGKSVGIAGLGRIGSAIAKRAEAFGCSVGYHSRSRKPGVHYEYHPSISSLASSCQILIVACSLTAQTRHIMDRKVLDALGPKGVLINIGRGALVDEPELVSALVEGRLAGVGLDVFEDEPRVPEQLLGLENVVLLPHVGSDTVETCEAMAHLLIRNLEAYFLREPLLTPVL